MNVLDEMRHDTFMRFPPADRSCSEVKTYKLSPEELAKYKTTPYKRPMMLDLVRTKDRSDADKARIENKLNNTKQEVSMKITKDQVLKLKEEGRTLEEVQKAMLSQKDNPNYQMQCAKVSYFYNGPKPKHEPVSDRKPIQAYIATAYGERERAEQLAEIMRRIGYEITCEWWLLEYTDDPARLEEYATYDSDGIRRAELVVVLLPGGYGTHAELGIAIGLGKEIIIHESDQAIDCIYYHAPGLKWNRGTELELIKMLIDRGRDAGC